MKEIYDAKLDPEFSEDKGYIDVDEMKVRKLSDGTSLPYRYMHGGFRGTAVRFSFCFPQKEAYEGRFYQYLSPFPGPEEELASLQVTGEDDKIGFCITHGAYYVETNMGSGAAFTSSSDDTITYRSSAAAAEFSRIKAQEVYGFVHRPYGYVYGGSGGGYRTLACIENTNAFDGACPYVLGSPYAIPNCQTTRAHAERILRHKIPQIIDAVDAGGSGDPYAGLNEEEAEALKESTLFGYPLKSWFCSADMNDGSLPVLAPAVKSIDPTYFEDFWTKEGYLGAVPGSSAQRERICMDAKVRLLLVPGKKGKLLEGKLLEGKEIDSRNGVNDAWKKMISTEAALTEEPWVELDNVPEGDDIYVQGAVFSVSSGAAAGKKLQIGRFEESRVYFKEGFGMDSIVETLGLLEKGDEVHLDNSDYIAIQTYHRHQVPSSDYKAWDQFRDEEGNPLYPQRGFLLGPYISGGGTGVKQDGLLQGKVISVAALLDEQAYPWQADWYRRKVASVHDGDESGIMRLWYFDNVLHDDQTASVDELHVTTYLAGLKQALIDVAAWVEKGIDPLPSSNYTVNGGEILVPESADERGGIQAVVNVTANGVKCAHVKVGETVHLKAKAEAPTGAGYLTSVEWSLDGDESFPEKGEFDLIGKGRAGIAETTCAYKNPGTYYAVVRVRSERNGDKGALYTQVRNIDRVRIIVE